MGTFGTGTGVSERTGAAADDDDDDSDNDKEPARDRLVSPLDDSLVPLLMLVVPCSVSALLNPPVFMLTFMSGSDVPRRVEYQ